MFLQLWRFHMASSNSYEVRGSKMYHISTHLPGPLIQKLVIVWIYIFSWAINKSSDYEEARWELLSDLTDLVWKDRIARAVPCNSGRRSTTAWPRGTCLGSSFFSSARTSITVTDHHKTIYIKHNSGHF